MRLDRGDHAPSTPLQPADQRKAACDSRPHANLSGQRVLQQTRPDLSRRDCNKTMSGTRLAGSRQRTHLHYMRGRRTITTFYIHDSSGGPCLFCSSRDTSRHTRVPTRLQFNPIHHAIVPTHTRSDTAVFTSDLSSRRQPVPQRISDSELRAQTGTRPTRQSDAENESRRQNTKKEADPQPQTRRRDTRGSPEGAHSRATRQSDFNPEAPRAPYAFGLRLHETVHGLLSPIRGFLLYVLSY
jgi:hypothetical protein